MKKNRKTALNSQLVYLRPPEEADLAELQQRYSASQAHLRGVANTKFDRDIFAEMLSNAKRDTNKSFLICRCMDNAIVGTISLSQIFLKSFRNAYLGYQLFSGYTGQGYMTSAVRLVLDYAFREAQLHRIEANVQPSNLASIAVLQRIGF